MQIEEMFALVFIFGMFGGVFIVFLGLRQRSQHLEMQHRERMAMIERGQIPLSEPHGHLHDRRTIVGGDAASSRSLSVGIIVVGLGLALMMIISVAGESPESGIGVGGAIAILGGAFIARSMLVRPEVPPPPSTSRTPFPPPPPPDDRI
jgi:hypothetical protein